VDREAWLRERRRTAEERHDTIHAFTFDAEFDAVMCIDAMENIPPEDWPQVVANLRRALRPGGHLYLTVEQVDDEELGRELADATARGLPVVRGEESRDGYHHYPSRAQVGHWMEEGMLVVVAEDYSPGDGYGYLHLLARAG
jgi:SAM-dependent methyltransferase